MRRIVALCFVALCFVGLCFVGLGLMTACDKKPEPPTPTPPTGGAQPTQPGEITWTKPAAWKDAPSKSPMRKATYGIAKAEGDPEDAELSVVNAGGSVADNVTRWEGQFPGSKAQISDKQVNGVTVTIVELTGTFKGGGPMMGGDGTPKEGWMMLGAIAEAKQLYFFKLTGPQKTVESARADFDALVGSIAAK